MSCLLCLCLTLDAWCVCVSSSVQQANAGHREYQRWPLSIWTFPSPIASPEEVSGPPFFISVDPKDIFSVEQIPHLSSDIFSWLSSVLISHYLGFVTDHKSSHTHTHTHAHAALTLARFLFYFFICGDGSAELANICCHNPPKCFISSKKQAMQTFRKYTMNDCLDLEVVQKYSPP